MDSLFERDTDLCERCGYDPCNCVAEVARRCARPPAGLAANLAPAPPPPHPAPGSARHRRWDGRISLDGLDRLLGLAIGSFEEKRRHFSPADAERLDITLEYIRAAREVIAQARQQGSSR